MKFQRFVRRRRGRCDSRTGVAAAELAACLPVIILLVLAMIECCTMIFLKQSVTVAAYEGVRTAVEHNATPAEVRGKCEGILNDRRVQQGTITISPANFETIPPGRYIEVTVSAPAGANSVIPGSFFRGRNLSGSAEMMKEF